MGKGAKRLVYKAAKETTNDCTLTIFKRAAEHTTIQNRRRRGRPRTQAHVFTAEQQHAEFIRRGHVPRYVENFVRGGHHRRAVSG